MPKASQAGIIESHTKLFSKNICRAISDMSGNSYEICKDTFEEKPFITEYKMTIFLSFSGVVQGEYLLALDESVAAKLIGINPSEITLMNLNAMRIEYSGFLKEVLNLSANLTIEGLTLRYGELTSSSATVVYGEIDFPDIISGTIMIKGHPGKIQCVFSLNLAKLKIGEQLANTLLELKELTELLEEKVEKRTEQLNQSNENLKNAMESLWGEMQLAKKIQTVLLPENVTFPGYDISGCLHPADDVGGDYYDVINFNNRLWFIIGDVSGHGVPAGLIMMMAQTAIHTTLTIKPDISPSDLLNFVNIVLTNNIQKLGEIKYMTITAISQLDDSRFSFSGLHQDIFIYRASSGTIELVETNGMWLGLMPEINDMLTVNYLTLNSGDVMILYSDGITEAADSNEKMFGEQNLINLLLKYGHKTSLEIRDKIIEALSPYKKKDDITLLVIKKKALPF